MASAGGLSSQRRRRLAAPAASLGARLRDAGLHPDPDPFDIGDQTANLLFPVYAVIGALALALARQLSGGRPCPRARPLAWPLAAVVGWTGLALLWTDDLRRGAIFLAAFVLPFGLLAVGFARLPFSRRALLGLYAALVATALLYAGVGLYQWATRRSSGTRSCGSTTPTRPSSASTRSSGTRRSTAATSSSRSSRRLRSRPRRPAEQAPRRRDRRDRRDLGRPPVLVLTVELRRADRRARSRPPP